MQDHAKLKLAYDFTPTLRASYTLGWWHNTAERRSRHLSARRRRARRCISGTVNIDGRSYTLAPTDFPLTSDDADAPDARPVAQEPHQGRRGTGRSRPACTTTRRTGRAADRRAPPAADGGGAGTHRGPGSGTGWNTLAAKGIWRPRGAAARTSSTSACSATPTSCATLSRHAGNWIGGARRRRWSATFERRHAGCRACACRTPGASRRAGRRCSGCAATSAGEARAAAVTALCRRNAARASPARSETPTCRPRRRSLGRRRRVRCSKASVGRAVRMPTVGELYQGGVTSTGTSSTTIRTCKPEKSLDRRTHRRDGRCGSGLRATLFHEDTQDALYSQTNVDRAAERHQHPERRPHPHHRPGAGAAGAATCCMHGLDLRRQPDLRRLEDRARTTISPRSVGKWQPRVPRWRANLLATYRPTTRPGRSPSARATAASSSTRSTTAMPTASPTSASASTSPSTCACATASTGMVAPLGIDNLNNYKYWNFHPYPQRTFHRGATL